MSVEQRPKTISSPTEVPVTPDPVVREVQPPAATTSEARVTTNDEWVKPSQVSTDRVRTADGTSKPKSEMEKAKEAFAKADEVGIEDTGEGIIETRMLRASEVQELMGELDSQRQASAAPPSSPPPITPPPAAMDPRPSSTPAAPPSAAPAKPVPSVPIQVVDAPPQEKFAIPEPKPTAPPRMPEIPTKVTHSTPPPAQPAAKPSMTSIPDIESILSTLPDRAYRQDPQIQGIVNDLTNLHTELAQFKSDLDSVRSRLESEVRDYWNVAEVKRIHFESIEEQLRLAKQEWNDSTKVYQQSAKRMSNELSSREKRIKDIQKRIDKTGDSIGRRAKDLDREKAKQALSQ
ncbi:MAG: hypothetical protein KGD60_10805 [Candidatus Thorarchaeota archaeon]|nr:hypothetical protein [Candidatus Thorarchaeota archaeon]